MTRNEELFAANPDLFRPFGLPITVYKFDEAGLQTLAESTDIDYSTHEGNDAILFLSSINAFIDVPSNVVDADSGVLTLKNKVVGASKLTFSEDWNIAGVDEAILLANDSEATVAWSYDAAGEGSFTSTLTIV